MPRPPKHRPIPNVLTGAKGEVARVSHWPIERKTLTRYRSDSEGMTDCMIHFDRIRVRGPHNARRVMYDGGLYVRIWGAGDAGNVRLAGALLLECAEIVTDVYYSAGYDERLAEAYGKRVDIGT